jgi:general stress protein CsbA
MFGRLFRKFGSLMSVIAALVVLALEYASYRKEHTFSLFWVGIAITMLLIGGYEIVSKRKDDKSPME